MEDGAFTTSIDFNLMDELLYDGFWLETTTTTDVTNFWRPCPPPTTTTSTDTDIKNPTSFYFLSPETNNNIRSSNTNPHQESSFMRETEKPTYTFGQPSLSYYPGMNEFSAQNQQVSVPSVSFDQPEENSRLWVGPNQNPICTVSVKKKLVQAINHLKDSIKDKDVLIQIWVPVKKGHRQVLTTNNQPFSLDPRSTNLVEYRDVSRNYQFAADQDSKEFVGLPGRVFLNKLPEWTPDVRFFKKEEYPRVNHAQQYDVRGSLALPVFEQGSGICLGVVEIVTTSQKLNYRPELENVCKALEAVDLKSSTPSPHKVEDCSESYQAAVTEIRNVLKCVCDTHKLPLVQTWAPCVQQRKGGCRHSDENYTYCVSTIDSACYVADQQVLGFHEACSEHHLLKGEGIAGKAFLKNQPCFSEDITAFSKTEYPLAHHARVFNLHAAVAIRLRSTYTETADFVLELFLPINCKGADEQRRMLDSLSSVIQSTCHSLRVVTDQGLAQEASDRERGRSLTAGRSDDDAEKHSKLVIFSQEPSPDASRWITNMMDPQHKGKGVSVSFDHQKEPGEFKVATEWDNLGLEFHNEPDFSNQHHQYQQESKQCAEGSQNLSFSGGHLPIGAKTNTEKRRTKTEKTISLEVLRQYFAGSLKDAAKNIGVCPTTLKRICRQHGITRWPSRKIKKVGHSLKKLQLVIDSVQGADGSIQLSSFYNNFPELVSPNVSARSHLPTSKMSDQLQQVNTQPLSPPNTASKSSSSSGSHSSSSSYCCSTGLKQSSSFPVGQNGLSEERAGGMLKRAWSDAELHDLSQEDPKLLVRSYSHKIFSDHASNEAPPVRNKVDDVSIFRVKVAFGEEKIRFSFQPHWGFKRLQQDVLRRFNMDNGTGVDLKYLDDDCEWVLLTCDADLEECIDIHRSCKNRTIKLSINNQAYRQSLGSSFGSNGPY